MKFLQKHTSGFTLIELLVVIAIIGILASTVMASLSGARSSASDTSNLAEAKELMKALELWRLQNNNKYPCSGDNGTGTNLRCGNATRVAQPAAIVGKTGVAATSMETALRTELKFATSFDATSTLVYAIRSDDGTANTSDRTSYTILVYQKEYDTDSDTGSDLNDYCKITTGTADARYDTEVTNKCPVEGIK